MKPGAFVLIIALTGAVAGYYFYESRSPAVSQPGSPVDPGQVAVGAAIYAKHCAACHGAELEGQPGWRGGRNPDGTLLAPPHDETGHTWHHADAMLFDVTKRGGQATAPAGFRSAMPAFADKLSDAEIWAALAFIKSRWPAHIRERQAMITERHNAQSGH